MVAVHAHLQADTTEVNQCKIIVCCLSKVNGKVSHRFLNTAIDSYVIYYGTSIKSWGLLKKITQTTTLPHKLKAF